MTRATRGRRLAIATAVAIAITCALPYGGASLAAAPATFTWSGASEALSGDARMSTAGNWAGGVAPSRGQRIALVLPALPCVSVGTCDHVLNDVPDLVVTSLSITQPGAPPPGPHVTQGGYSLSGEAIRLTGPLTTGVDVTTGPVGYEIGLGLPLQLVGRDAGVWRLEHGVRMRSPVTGRALRVVTADGGALSVESPSGFEVERFVLRGGADAGVTSVYAAAIGARSRTPVSFRDTYVELAGASLGPLTVRDSDLEVSDPSTVPRRSPVTRVHGGVRLGPHTSLYVRELARRHPSLRADGPVRLGGTRLVLAPYDCRDVVHRVPLILISGRQVTGLFSDDRGRPLRDGAVITLPRDDYCGPTRIQVDYTATTVTLTAGATD